MSCAVGCLIPDDAYDPKVEGLVVSDVTPLADGTWSPSKSLGEKVLRRVRTFADALNAGAVPASVETHWLLRRLQHIHDGHEPSKWKEQLAALEMELTQGPVGDP